MLCMLADHSILHMQHLSMHRMHASDHNLFYMLEHARSLLHRMQDHVAWNHHFEAGDPPKFASNKYKMMRGCKSLLKKAEVLRVS